MPKPLPHCDVSHIKVEQRTTDHHNGGFRVDFSYFLSGCTLTLENLPPQQQKRQVQFPVIHPSNGVVVYRGGPIAEGNDPFIINNCRFDITAKDVPPKPVQDILEAALQKSDLDAVEANVHGLTGVAPS